MSLETILHHAEFKRKIKNSIFLFFNKTLLLFSGPLVLAVRIIKFWSNRINVRINRKIHLIRKFSVKQNLYSNNYFGLNSMILFQV